MLPTEHRNEKRSINKTNHLRKESNRYIVYDVPLFPCKTHRITFFVRSSRLKNRRSERNARQSSTRYQTSNEGSELRCRKIFYNIDTFKIKSYHGTQCIQKNAGYFLMHSDLSNYKVSKK